MEYPSLIFAGGKPEKTTDETVVSDLKLDLILPEGVAGYLLYRPEKETFLLRREMFAELLADPGAVPTLTGMRDTLASASRLYTALNRAVSENAAAYVLAFLFCEVKSFCEKAAALPYRNTLISRFRGAIGGLLDEPAFREAALEAERVRGDLDKITAVSLNCLGDEATLSKGTGTGVAVSLERCSTELGISVEPRPARKFRLQKGMAEGLAKLYPEEFGAAREFYRLHRDKVRGDLFDLLPEADFILGIIALARRAESCGIPYSFPALSGEKGIELRDVYDVTLLEKPGTTIVPNDVRFTSEKPFFYLTGANGGGKTTYLRAVGISVLTFCAGAPVFCTGGSASLVDAVFTHFPRDERFEGSGRFLEEKKRADDIVARQNGNSLVLLNETYATTGEEKATLCTSELARLLRHSGSFGLYITHQHSVGETEVPFLGVIVDESDGNRRTYRIEERRLPPRSFAADILEKYGLTPDKLPAFCRKFL